MAFNLDLLGHIAFAFLLLGKWAVIHKHRWGFISWAIGAGTWGVIGVLMGMSSLASWNLVYVIMYAYGWWKWGKDDSN